MEEWLLDRIQSGKIKVKPLNKKAVIHDNCWPKASGDDFFEKTRALLAALGIDVVEPPHTREMALCCGMCAGAARFRLRDILRASKNRLREFAQIEADMIIDYCGGCNWLFSLANRLSSSKQKKPMYHLLEVVQMAAGETPKHRTDKRTGKIVATMTGPLLARYLTPRRFWIEQIGDRRV